MAISVFISYALESEVHNKKVRQFASKLQLEGVDVQIFTEMKLGERIPVFMEQIESADFTLIICTPEYSQRARNRSGGVGYEWNIVTTSVANSFDERKFIPILFSGDWHTSVPSWARGKLGIDYRNESEEEFQKLIEEFLRYELQKCIEILDVNGKTVMPPEEESMKEKSENRMMIMTENGESEVVDVIVPFKFIDNDKRYVVFTKNEKDADGNITVYVSETVYKPNCEYPYFSAVSDEDWPRIKQLLWELIEAGEEAGEKE